MSGNWRRAWLRTRSGVAAPHFRTPQEPRLCVHFCCDRGGASRWTDCGPTLLSTAGFDRYARCVPKVSVLGPAVVALVVGGIVSPSSAGDLETPRATAASRYVRLVLEASSAYRLDPRLVDAVIRTESAYRPFAVSPRGAVGPDAVDACDGQPLRRRQPFRSRPERLRRLRSPGRTARRVRPRPGDCGLQRRSGRSAPARRHSTLYGDAPVRVPGAAALPGCRRGPVRSARSRRIRRRSSAGRALPGPPGGSFPGRHIGGPGDPSEPYSDSDLRLEPHPRADAEEELLADWEVQRGSRLQPEPPEDADVAVAGAALIRGQLLPEDDVVRRVVVRRRDPHDRPRRGMAVQATVCGGGGGPCGAACRVPYRSPRSLSIRCRRSL